jgi:uncharacterized protein (TIGR02145 family)
MKKNLFYAVLLFTVSFASCKKDNNNENESQGTIQFGLSVSKQQTKQENMSASEVPASIVITIADSKGKVVIDSKKIALFNMNGSYISESLSLVIGNYNITKFMVLNNSDSVIYATPLKGSNLAYLVTTPLPIAFNISKNNVTKMVPEVLSVESFKPEDFGYYSFSFDVVKTFDFLATVMEYNFSVKNWELTTANIIIRAADSTVAYSGTLAAVTNQITLRDNSTSYFLSVSKVGYKTYTAIFTPGELKLYFKSVDNGPLIIMLNESETVADIDGNVYLTVKIGTQVWMEDNLRTTHYNDGTDIPNVIDNTAWFALTTPGYCWNDNDISNKALYGAFYNWYSVGTEKLCPIGWHVPSNAEWLLLINNLGGESIAGGKMKETGTSQWWSQCYGANNISGFSALPAGGRVTNDFNQAGGITYFWSSTEIYGISGWDCVLLCGGQEALFSYHQKVDGYSVRCIKD